MKNFIGQQFGNYRLVRLIGQGGFADVYLAEHIHLNTQAAIKVLQMRLIGTNIEQFRNEARTIASLLHPNIIRVLDFGLEDGIPFLVMDYAPNGTLRQRYPKGVQLHLVTIVSYVKQVASALQYAHDRKLIHRDVKPENMLLGRNNEVLLSDFGLVLIAQSTGSRSTQEMGGTVAYMAPEQLQGKPRPASDQYSLGVVVYEWLSGERPFNGAFVEIASQQMLTPPPPLYNRVPGISPAIEQVVLTALAKEPQQRFASVQAFATALEQACISPGTRKGIPVPQTGFQYISPDLLSQSSQPTYITPPRQSSQPPMRILQDEPAPQLMQSSQPSYTTPAGQSSQSTAMNNANNPQSAYMTEPSASEPPVLPATDRSPDRDQPSQRRVSRRAIVIGLAGIVALGAGGGAITWAASGGLQKLGLIPTPTSTSIVTPQPDPDPQPSQPLGTILVTYRGHSKAVWTGAWSPDGQHIATGGDDGTVQIWDPTTGKQVLTYTGYVGKSQYVSVVTLAWSPDGKRIVSSATLSGTGPFLPDVRVWDVSTGNTLFSYKGHIPSTAGHSNVVSQVAWSPDGKYIASAGAYDKTVQLWDSSTGETVLTYRGHTYDVWKVQWSRDGKYLASASGDPGTPSTGGDIQVWDTNGKRIVTYTGHTDGGHSVEVTDIFWSPDSTNIVSAGREGTIQVWKATSGNNFLTYAGSDPVGWSPDDKRIVSGAVSLDHTVQVRDATTGYNTYIYHGYSAQINVLAWSPDSTRIALAGLDGIVQVWQAK